jgi:glyoxylase-like metal-dependent hydrolase (beta-lactamase superfamily II)
LEAGLPKERVGEQVYVYLSELYAQVTATVIITGRGNVVVDTLLFPSEAKEVLAFATRGGVRVRYLINTHSHLDHVAGNYLYSGTRIIAHARARSTLEEEAQNALSQAAADLPELQQVRLRLPDITGTSEIVLRFGGLTMHMIPLPGHSYDSFGVYIEEERILVAGDAVLPVPHFVGCDPDLLMRSLQKVRALPLNTIIQGHGDVILKGEIKEALEQRMQYLRQVKKFVSDAVASGASLDEIRRSQIESFGGSRLDLDGLTQALHEDNVAYLYEQLKQRQPGASPVVRA